MAESCVPETTGFFEYVRPGSDVSEPRKSKRVPVAILAWVSTDRQTTARQIQELEQVAVENGWEVVEVIETTGLSGKCQGRRPARPEPRSSAGGREEDPQGAGP